MRALFIRFVLALIMVPYMVRQADAQEQDFSRHNRFPFAKQYYPLEPEKLPPIREPLHTVQGGKVNLGGTPIDPQLLAKRFVPGGFSVGFGQPRTQAVMLNSLLSPPVVCPPAPAKEPVTPKPAKPLSQRTHVAAQRRLAGRVVPLIKEPKSYPVGVGFSLGAPETEPSAGPHDERVTGKLLPSR